MQISEFIHNLPKVELHLHLEGCVTPEFWFNLLRKHQPQIPITLEELEKRFVLNSFADFMETYRDIILSFQEPEDLYDLTTLMMQNLVNQQVRYAEVMITPLFFVRRGLAFFEIMQAIDLAASKIEKEHDICLKLIFDGPRNFGKEVVSEVFDMALSDKTGRVIGVGLGGDEKNFPAELFVGEFSRAQANGLKTIAHAGETDDEISIKNTIELLKVSRIGHGLGISKNSKTEQLIFDKGITLDLCPGSNQATKVIETLSEHPLTDYMKRNYPVTLNSDDPGLFKTNLNKEYQNGMDVFKLNKKEIIRIVFNSIDGSFMSGEQKNEIKKEVQTLTATPF